jgi:integral membrane protein
VNPSTTRTAFRTIAIAEAISWAGLLITMFFKWIVAADPNTGAQGGVPIMGPIHGVVFIGYVVMCLVARRSFGWSPRTTVLALAASIPPFFTYVFEVAADRRGLLGQAVAEPETAPV